MSANVETMFSVREKPWHGLGQIIADAPNSEEAIRLAGLDWNVYQQDLVTDNGLPVPGYKANIRKLSLRAGIARKPETDCTVPCCLSQFLPGTLPPFSHGSVSAAPSYPSCSSLGI